MYLWIQKSQVINAILASEDEKEDIKMIRKIIHIEEEKCNGCGLVLSY